MIKTVAIAALAVVTFAGATVSSPRAEPNTGSSSQNTKEKQAGKKLQKKALRAHEKFKRDSAGDPEAFKAKWGPRCQKVKADLQAANCEGKATMKCVKIAARCPL